MKTLLKIFILAFLIGFVSCKDDVNLEENEKDVTSNVQEDSYEFGYNLSNYTVVRDTIKSGDTFGLILERNNMNFSRIYQIAEKSKDSFDIRKLQVGKPYTLLCSKDEEKEPLCFIYQPTRED